jgi:DNA-directed RNA polymerase subunit RPC12/RpoP
MTRETAPESVSVAARCTRCGVEFTEAQIAVADRCPACGSKGVPCDPAKDVDVRINWHELRILCMWAENWAHRCDVSHEDGHEPMVPLVHVIAARLQAQRPELAHSPLTMSGEVRQLREAFPGAKVETHGIPEGEQES